MNSCDILNRYTPPAINFSRIVDQTSIFNWSQGAPYMLNGNIYILTLPQELQWHFPLIHKTFFLSSLSFVLCRKLCRLIGLGNIFFLIIRANSIHLGLDTFVPWEMVAPPEYCPEAVSNCSHPPCPPPSCIAIYAVIPQVNPPLQGNSVKDNVSCVNVSWSVNTHTLAPALFQSQTWHSLYQVRSELWWFCFTQVLRHRGLFVCALFYITCAFSIACLFLIFNPFGMWRIWHKLAFDCRSNFLWWTLACTFKFNSITMSLTAWETQCHKFWRSSRLLHLHSLTFCFSHLFFFWPQQLCS